MASSVVTLNFLLKNPTFIVKYFYKVRMGYFIAV